MLTLFSRIILKYPILILTGIATITGICFYSAFLSEQYLRVDFSLEQLFPESDPEKDVYDALENLEHTDYDKDKSISKAMTEFLNNDLESKDYEAQTSELDDEK